MRIVNKRYRRDISRYNLAVRMMYHGARSQTIRQWTGLSERHVRGLFVSGVCEPGMPEPVRRRGPSPRAFTFFLRTPRMRSATAALAGLFYVMDVIPLQPGAINARELRNVERGERICTAFEIYQSVTRALEISLEHAVLLVQALADGNELRIGRCVECGGAIVFDPYGLSRRVCTFCSEVEEFSQPARQRVLKAVSVSEDPTSGEQQSLF